MLPDFSDFLAQLDLKEVDRLADPMVPDRESVLLYRPDDPEGTNRAFQLALRRAEALSTARTIALLNLYHDWLKRSDIF